MAVGWGNRLSDDAAFDAEMNVGCEQHDEDARRSSINRDDVLEAAVVVARAIMVGGEAIVRVDEDDSACRAQELSFVVCVCDIDVDTK